MAVNTANLVQPNYPLVLQQASSFSSLFLFGQGKVSRVDTVTAGASPTVTVSDAHCLALGNIVHLAVADDCCQLRIGCYEVTEIIDAATAVLRLIEGQAAAGQSDTANGVGFITRAINLTGFNLRGAIATRSPSGTVSPPNLIGSIASGDNAILVNGDIDVFQNDTLTFSDAGLTNVRVQGVFKSYSSSSSTVASQTVLVVDANATATVSVDSPQKFTIQGGVLADFEFEMADDPRCGRAVGRIDPRDLSNILIPVSDCCEGDLIKIGCYQLAIQCGTLAPRDTYPRDSYITYSRTFGSGPAYLQSGFIGV